MSDARLRALERAWRGSRAPEDEAALLQARLKHGLVPRSRIELAARFGLESAQLVFGAPTPGSAGWRGDPADPDARSVHALHAALARRLELLLLPLLGANHGDLAARDVLGPRLDAIEAWALCPCERHLAAVRALPPVTRGWGAYPVGDVHQRTRRLERAVLEGELAHAASDLLGAAALERGVRDRLRAWLLGEALPDPAALARERLGAMVPELLARFRQRFLDTISALWLEHGSLEGHPSLWEPGGPRVVPVTIIEGRATKSWFPGRYGGKLCTVNAAELLRGLLPRWADEGLRVAPVVGWAWVELDPRDLARHLNADLPEQVAEEIRQHMAWVERKAAKKTKRTPARKKKKKKKKKA